MIAVLLPEPGSLPKTSCSNFSILYGMQTEEPSRGETSCSLSMAEGFVALNNLHLGLPISVSSSEHTIVSFRIVSISSSFVVHEVPPPSVVHEELDSKARPAHMAIETFRFMMREAASRDTATDSCFSLRRQWLISHWAIIKNPNSTANLNVILVQPLAEQDSHN
jgi:hypothetical protein